MRIDRYFTKKLKGPYDGIQFISFKLNKKSSGAHPLDEVIAPDFWSETAVDIIANKYMRKTKAQCLPHGCESDVRQVIDRLVNAWVLWGERENIFDTDEDKLIFSDELKYLIAHQKMAPNSPQWFNTGLYEAYGIKSEAKGLGHYYFDKKNGKVVESQERSQLHACFIQSLEDSLLGNDGIMELLTKEARLFKYGSGSGTNFSNLREQGSSLSGGGVSSGLMSFIKVSDRSAGAIKSGGTTRRAAKMICLDGDHPDVFEFIRFKREEEFKVSSMICGSKILNRFTKGALKVRESENHDDFKSFVNDANIVRIKREGEMLGIPARFIQSTLREVYESPEKLIKKEFNTDWQGEAFETVGGQNANFSIRLPHHFFEKYNKDQEWDLIGRLNKKTVKKVKARELMNEIALSAWSSADPGVQYDDTINEWHTCIEDGRIVASNPCSEYMFLDDTACNLASLNLATFYNHDKNTIDLDGLCFAAKLTTIVLDISVTMAHYPSEKLAKNSYEYRTLGLGFTNLGGLLMSMGLSYDSDHARAIAGALSSLISASSFSTSAHLASFLGTFAHYQRNEKNYKRVLQNHYLASMGKAEGYEGISIKPMALDHGLLDKVYTNKLREAWDETLFKVNQYGLRNAQLTAIAPTGTISLIMDCDTTGIEPEFALVKYKDLAGGGSYKFVNKRVRGVLAKLGYKKEQVDEIEQTILKESSVENAKHIKEEHLAIFDCAIAPVGMKRVLHYKAHLLMMAAIQPYISGAISKTINLPQETTIAEIERIYCEGRDLMLKSLALYRQGSKLSEPLTIADSKDGEGTISLFYSEEKEELPLRNPNSSFKNCPECG